MLSRFNHQTQNRIFYGLIILALYLVYTLAVKQTFQTMALNTQLIEAQNQDQHLGSSFVQLQRKDKFYTTAVKSYQVKADDRENRLWQAISGMAIANHVEIGFDPNSVVLADTLNLQQGIVKQQFNFSGDYFNIVKLMDTLSRSKGIGKICELRLFSAKDNRNAAATLGQIELRVLIGGIVK